MGSGLPWNSGEILLGASVAIALFQAASKVAPQGLVGPKDFWRLTHQVTISSSPTRLLGQTLLRIHILWNSLRMTF